MPSTELTTAGALDRAVEDGHSESGLPVVFAGHVRSGALRISRLAGNRSDSLHGLSLPPNAGLGGKAMIVGRPVFVRDYTSARSISHEYDTAVASEGLRAMVAIPVRANGTVRAVLYGGTRAAYSFGDDVVNCLVSVGDRLGRELQTLPMTSPSTSVGLERAPTLLRENCLASAEKILTSLSEETDDALRGEGTRICESLLSVLRGLDSPQQAPKLSSRELAVLELAASGHSDLSIAGTLHIDIASVRAAMCGLRRTFGVHSRHAAVSAARSSGVLA